MKTFLHRGEQYVRIYPSPRLYNSQTIRAVTNRGDVFAMRVSDCQFTILPGRGIVTAQEMKLIKARNAPRVVQYKLDL